MVCHRNICIFILHKGDSIFTYNNNNNNNNLDLKGITMTGLDWIYLAEDIKNSRAMLNMEMNLLFK
jgi:hypothetical protein